MFLKPPQRSYLIELEDGSKWRIWQADDYESSHRVPSTGLRVERVDGAVEESARRILGIFRSHQLRAGQTLMRDQVRKEHLSDGRWQMRDFLAGLQYAIEREWIATPSPNVLRITERGVVAQEH